MQIVVLVLAKLVLLQFAGETCAAVCQPQASCLECLRSPGCAWCKQKDFLKAGEPNERRCDSLESLRARKCENRNVVDPQPDTISEKDNDLNSNLENVVQLKPQSIRVKLRVGVPHEFKVEFRRAEGYPIDLYYLMDLSYSMKDDLEKIKNLGQDILNKLRVVTQTVRIGFGSFVDKERLPYISEVKFKRRNPCPRADTCQPAFAFKNVLPLTAEAKEFEREVSKQTISGNLDSPEAGLDAIMQAAVCQKEIKWGNVTRILVYTSDDTFHMAGDGRLAGIFQPHDGQCHLRGDGTYDGTTFDYPSVGHLSRVLQANNIQLIFAVTEKSVPAYEALSALIPQSVVAVLEDDSSNVVQLISEAYENLSSTLLLEHDHTPDSLNVSYMSYCREERSEWQHRGECTKIKVNEKVTFTVRLNVSECLTKPESFEIRMQGISEVLKVTVETLCDCNCGDEEKDSKQCTGNGTLVCGVCSCNEGFQGQRCDCKHQNHISSTNCRASNDSEVCNGHGSCECGQCKCTGLFRGQYCECDSGGCSRYNNKLCNDQGKCNCSICECNGNYTGDACECSKDTNMCLSKNGLLCSGHGRCTCNQCICKKNFMGEDCFQISDPCNTYKQCVSCKVTSESSKNCTEISSGELCSVEWQEQGPENRELQCQHEQVVYDVKLKDDGKVLIRYAFLPSSVDKTRVIIGTSVSAIILIGIVIIIVYKVLLELYDLREYRSFVNAQKQTDWNEQTQNPLFKGATTTVLNPLHSQDN